MIKLRCITSLVVLTLLLAISSHNTFAGPYADALGKRLVASTTPAEKRILVRWMFASMSLHPDLKDFVSMTPAQRTDANKAFAKLITRMITETCATEAREAVKYEGASALESAFSLFGQVAARELFANPKVAEGLGELEKLVDSKALQKALTEEPSDTKLK